MIMTGVCVSHAQDLVVESEPDGSYERRFLDHVREWNALTPLGDVREINLAADDVELRVWRGFHQERHEGIAIMRRDGTWSAAGIAIKQYELDVPDTVQRPDLVRDGCTYTIIRRSSVTEHNEPLRLTYRLYCPELVDIGENWSRRDFAELWEKLVAGGLLTLPPSGDRGDLVLFGGHYYVVELRIGNRYRATSIDYFEFESEVERQLLAVVRLLFPLFWEARTDIAE